MINRPALFNKTNKNAFTLVELLIVVGIIGILAVLVIAVINPDQLRKQATDTSRQKDLSIISTALEQYYANNNEYPPIGGANGIECLQNTLVDSDDDCIDGGPGNEPQYLKAISLTKSDTDPEYCYAVANNAQDFVLCAPYEQEPTRSATDDVAGTPCVPTMTGLTAEADFGVYCIENPF